MAGWHHQLNGHEFEQTLGDSEGQGSLASMGSQRVRHNLVTEQEQQEKGALQTSRPEAKNYSKVSKSLQIINAGVGVEKSKPSYTIGGNVNRCSHYEEEYGGSLKD